MTAPSRSVPDEALAQSDWLIPELIKRPGVTILSGDAKAGKSRLLAYLVSRMLPQPNGGTLLFAHGEPFAIHRGFRRILWLCGDERPEDAMTRMNGYALAEGIEPKADWPITYVNAASMQLQRPADRAVFEEMYLADGKYDVLILETLGRMHAGDSNAMLSRVRDWSKQYGIAAVVEDPGCELVAAPEDVRLSLRRKRGATAPTCWLERHGQDSTIVLTIPLIDHGDPKGFRVAVA